MTPPEKSTDLSATPPLKSFTHLMSPLSWLFFFLGFLPMLLLLFRPTPFEVLIFMLVDTGALMLTSLVDRRFFRFLFPDLKRYFPDLIFEGLGEAPLKERAELFQSMIQFPARRALYSTVLSLAKSFPAALVIVSTGTTKVAT